MASLLDRYRRPAPPSESRYSFNQWVQDSANVAFDGHRYTSVPTTYGEHAGERIEGNFDGIVQGAYKTGGIVFACAMVRMQVFSQTRFAFARYDQGVRLDPFTTDALGLLENPWPNGSTAELLARMEQDVSLAGNFYATVVDGQIKRLPPDEVIIVSGSQRDPNVMNALEAQVVGYLYQPGGPGSTEPSTMLMPEQVCHWSPIPDPLAFWRGMSWVTPILRDVEGDKAAADHKLKFFQQGATPNMVVTLDKSISEDSFKAFKEIMEQSSSGLENAYKTLYLGGGADVEVVGQSFEQMSFKATIGSGETRIAASAGVPPVLVGLSEGLQAATYSNYGQARRRFADITMEHLWAGSATALESLIVVPEFAELIHDTRGMPFLREDEKDAAEIQSLQSSAMRQLIDGGFDPQTVITAVNTHNWNLLRHTDLVSVQLQPPGSAPPGSSEQETPDE